MYAAEIARLVGCEVGEVLQVSGKTGRGVPELLDHVVATVPPPVGDADAPARAMIFDSVYDTFRGVVTYVRGVDGELKPRERIEMMSTHADSALLEIGVISPDFVAWDVLGFGEGGCFITGATAVPQPLVR